MNAQHTPGPWVYDEDYIFAGSIGAYIADVHTDDMTSGRYVARKDADAIIDANAQLIAAAPDLLEALQVLVRDCGAVDAGIELEPAIYQAQAAIAKATGGEV